MGASAKHLALHGSWMLSCAPLDDSLSQLMARPRGRPVALCTPS
jgi:hypothetical protein